MLNTLEIATLAPFTAGALLASIGIVHVSGYIGAKGDNLALTGMNSALILALVLASLVIAVQGINWSVAVVIAGSAFLIAPFLVQPLPEGLQNGAAGLMLYAVLALCGLAACATVLWA